MSLDPDFLYENAFGRLLLKVFSARRLSILAGRFFDSPLSKCLIPSFVSKNGIELSECENTDFHSFNDCFTRQLKKELRPIDMDPKALIAPCDGLLSVWKAEKDTILPVKQSHFLISDLFRDEKLAEEFYGGTCLVYRLCVNHYHRYIYPESGSKGENTFIEGKLHTVRPVALRNLPVFTENCREYTLIDTESFGKIAQIEVGAMFVGKIDNYHGRKRVLRGEEKGKFLYGGSTIILLLKKDAVSMDEKILQASLSGQEYPVKMGERVGSCMYRKTANG